MQFSLFGTHPRTSFFMMMSVLKDYSSHHGNHVNLDTFNAIISVQSYDCQHDAFDVSGISMFDNCHYNVVDLCEAYAQMQHLALKS